MSRFRQCFPLLSTFKYPCPLLKNVYLRGQGDRQSSKLSSESPDYLVQIDYKFFNSHIRLSSLHFQHGSWILLSTWRLLSTRYEFDISNLQDRRLACFHENRQSQHAVTKFSLSRELVYTIQYIVGADFSTPNFFMVKWGVPPISCTTYQVIEILFISNIF